MADVGAIRRARRLWRSTAGQSEASRWPAAGCRCPSRSSPPGLRVPWKRVEPDIVISLGLWPGEPVIRMERIGINVADFEIADNEGTRLTDAPVSGNGVPAVLATLPNRPIRDALLAAGIPARISSTAGTFLCNATLYTTLTHAETKRRRPLTGFMHVPYLPEQVAELLQSVEDERRLEQHQRADIASMELATMVKALEIAIATTAKSLT